MADDDRLDAPYGVVDLGDKIIVGAPHGQQVELSDELKRRVQDVAKRHGAWYEGAGGDIESNKDLVPQYKGSWDEQHASSVKGYPSEYLAPMFSNVEVNKPHETFEDPNRTIMASLIANQDKMKYFKDRRYDEKVLRDFLQQGSEGDVDFLKMSQLPATKDNLRKFFSTGERLAWPENWQEYPHNLGKIAKRAEDDRNRYLLEAPPGVYFAGAGHIPELKTLNKDLRVIGGERAAYADGGSTNDLPFMARQSPENEIGDALREHHSDEEARLRETASRPMNPGLRDALTLASYAVAAKPNPFRNKVESAVNEAKDTGQYFADTVSGRRSFDPTSDEAIKHALNIAGSMTLGSGAFESPAGALNAGLIRPSEKVGTLYHGSPVQGIERFDFNKIGTGVGEQNFGWGLNAAENEKTARFFKDYTSPESGGAMYELDIKRDPRHFIDWSQPVSKQSEHVQEILNKLNIPQTSQYMQTVGGKESLAERPIRGGEAYNILAKRMESEDLHPVEGMANQAAFNKYAAASEVLRRLGIGGTKFYDPHSLGRMNNYSMFDPNDIQITREYKEDGGKIQRKTFEPIHGLKITPPSESLSSEGDIRDYQLARHAYEFEGGPEPVAPRRPVVLDAPLLGGKKKLGTLPYDYAPVVEKALNLAYGQKTLPLYFNRMTAPLGMALDAYEASKFVGRDPKDVKNYTGVPGLVLSAGKKTLPFIGMGAGAGASDIVGEDREEKAEGGAMKSRTIKGALDLARNVGNVRYKYERPVRATGGNTATDANEEAEMLLYEIDAYMPHLKDMEHGPENEEESLISGLDVG